MPPEDERAATNTPAAIVAALPDRNITPPDAVALEPPLEMFTPLLEEPLPDVNVTLPPELPSEDEPMVRAESPLRAASLSVTTLTSTPVAATLLPAIKRTDPASAFITVTQHINIIGRGSNTVDRCNKTAPLESLAADVNETEPEAFSALELPPLAIVTAPPVVAEESAETETDPPELQLLEPARAVTDPAAEAASPFINVAALLVLPPDVPVITLTEPVDSSVDEPLLTVTVPLESAVEPLDSIKPLMLANDPPLTRDTVTPIESDMLELEPADSLTLLPAPLSLSPANTWMVPA